MSEVLTDLWPAVGQRVGWYQAQLLTSQRSRYPVCVCVCDYLSVFVSMSVSLWLCLRAEGSYEKGKASSSGTRHLEGPASSE